jgi:hypothetical protein
VFECCVGLAVNLLVAHGTRFRPPCAGNTPCRRPGSIRRGGLPRTAVYVTAVGTAASSTRYATACRSSSLAARRTSPRPVRSSPGPGSDAVFGPNTDTANAAPRHSRRAQSAALRPSRPAYRRRRGRGPRLRRVGRRRRSVDRRISQTSARYDLAVSDRRAARPAICLKMIVRNEAHIIHENGKPYFPAARRLGEQLLTMTPPEIGQFP